MFYIGRLADITLKLGWKIYQTQPRDKCSELVSHYKIPPLSTLPFPYYP